MIKTGLCLGSLLAGLIAFTAAERGARAKTTWTLLYDNVNSGNVIFSVDAVDDQHAWALGVEKVGGNSSPVGLATSNGQTFGMMPLPATSGGQFDITVFLVVAFADTQNGWIFGTKFSMGGEEHTLWKSDNGGMSWDTTFSPTVGIMMMQALPTGQLFAVGEDVFLRSPDGISYEEVSVPVPSGHTLDELFMFNADCGFVVASTDPEDGPVTGAVLWTPDGGDTWETRAEGLPYRLGGMSFVTADLGWLAAKGASEGGILKTTDGGRNWSLQSQPDHPPPPMSSDPAPVTECVDVRFFDDRRGVALCLACTGNCEPTSEEEPSYFTVLSWTSDGGVTWEMDPDYEEKIERRALWRHGQGLWHVWDGVSHPQRRVHGRPKLSGLGLCRRRSRG